MTNRKKWQIAAACICAISGVLLLTLDLAPRSIELSDGSVLRFESISFGTNIFTVHRQFASKVLWSLPGRLAKSAMSLGMRGAPRFDTRSVNNRISGKPKLRIGLTATEPNGKVSSNWQSDAILEYRVVGRDLEGTRLPAITQNHENHHEIVLLSDIGDSWQGDELDLRIYSLSIRGGKRTLIAEFPFKNPIPKDQRFASSNRSNVSIPFKPQ